MKLTINTEETEIVVVDTQNLIESKYFEIIDHLTDYNSEYYKFYLDDFEIDYNEFVDVINTDIKINLFEQISLFVVDDKVNEQVIFKRKDNSLFAIKYSVTF